MMCKVRANHTICRCMRAAPPTIIYIISKWVARKNWVATQFHNLMERARSPTAENAFAANLLFQE